MKRVVKKGVWSHHLPKELFVVCYWLSVIRKSSFIGEDSNYFWIFLLPADFKAFFISSRMCSVAVCALRASSLVYSVGQ